MTTQTNYLSYVNMDNLQDFFCPVAPQQASYQMEHSRFDKGEYIYLPEDVAAKIYFVEEGRIKIGSYSKNGKEIIREVLIAGHIFGELALFGEYRRSEFAQAMEYSRLCALPLDLSQYLMEKNPNFRSQILQLVGNRLMKTQKRLESLVFKDARSRIIEFLSNLGRENGQKLGYETLVPKFFTHQEIANLTGTSRQTVTTVLNNLRDLNLIYFNRKKLLIRDLDKLSEMVDD